MRPVDISRRTWVLTIVAIVVVWLGGISAVGAALGVPGWALAGYAMWIVYQAIQLAMQTIGVLAGGLYAGPWGALRPARMLPC